MAKHPPTPEQQAIIDAASQTQDNLLVTARAGAAKTTTLEMVAAAVKTPTLCLAFNKAIATEMATRLPSWCEAKTLHSLGYKAWADHIGRRCKIDGKKKANLLRNRIKEIERDAKGDKKKLELAAELWAGYADMMQCITHLAVIGYFPPWPGTFPLVSREEIELPVELSVEEESLVYSIVEEAGRLALQGEIDFDDMILMPTVYHAKFPRFPLVLIDEAQDLSVLNHEMLSLIARQRLIAVGDPAQAIYGFRGADANSMNKLKSRFGMREMYLTTTFRCASRIVEHVHWRCPDMRWPEWAAKGEIEWRNSWSADDFPADEETIIICRNNAPLFTTAMRLLRQSRRVELAGNDLAKTLIRDMESLSGGRKKDPDFPQEAALRALAKWKADKLKRYKGSDTVTEKASIIQMFLEAEPTLGRAVAKAQHLFNQTGPIKLMTVHKAKGLEWPTVHILDEERFTDKGQDPNLRYVAATRAKERIVYIHSEGMLLPADE